MAVEIALDFSVARGQGYALPLSVLPFDGEIEASASPDSPGKTQVFVFDPEESAVKRRNVVIDYETDRQFATFIILSQQ